MSYFADLRLNHGAGQQEDSFWPSFTDIMAVVVMIFLITTSILILRNWELIRQITQTSEAEKRAMELARETSAAKATIEEQLADARARITILRLELLRSEQERQKRQAELAAERERSQRLAATVAELQSVTATQARESEQLGEQLQQARVERSTLQQRLEQETRSTASLGESLQQLTARFAELQAQFETSRGQLASTREVLEQQRQRYAQLEQRSRATESELGELRQAFSAQRAELGAAREAIDEQRSALSAARESSQQQQAQLSAAREALGEQRSELAQARESTTLVSQRYESLIGEYDDLKVRYDKLIKPARTPAGKQVVEVRYWRSGDRYNLSLREPGAVEFRDLELAELHQVLSGLRDRHPNSLYVRIIFPDESGLSYAEAWGFTQDLLSRYDYYHREP